MSVFVEQTKISTDYFKSRLWIFWRHIFCSMYSEVEGGPITPWPYLAAGSTWWRTSCKMHLIENPQKVGKLFINSIWFCGFLPKCGFNWSFTKWIQRFAHKNSYDFAHSLKKLDYGIINVSKTKKCSLFRWPCECAPKLDTVSNKVFSVRVCVWPEKIEHMSFNRKWKFRWANSYKNNGNSKMLLDNKQHTISKGNNHIA